MLTTAHSRAPRSDQQRGGRSHGVPQHTDPPGVHLRLRLQPIEPVLQILGELHHRRKIIGVAAPVIARIQQQHGEARGMQQAREGQQVLRVAAPAVQQRHGGRGIGILHRDVPREQALAVFGRDAHGPVRQPQGGGRQRLDTARRLE